MANERFTLDLGIVHDALIAAAISQCDLSTDVTHRIEGAWVNHRRIIVAISALSLMAGPMVVAAPAALAGVTDVERAGSITAAGRPDAPGRPTNPGRPDQPGQSAPGQPTPGNPGQGNPGQGNPGQGNPESPWWLLREIPMPMPA